MMHPNLADFMENLLDFLRAQRHAVAAFAGQRRRVHVDETSQGIDVAALRGHDRVKYKIAFGLRGENRAMLTIVNGPLSTYCVSVESRWHWRKNCASLSFD